MSIDDQAIADLERARNELGEVADRLLKARTMGRPAREDLGRRINAARARINSALIDVEEKS